MEAGRDRRDGHRDPEEYGGGGQDDYRYNVVLQEESARANVTLGTLRTHLDVVLPYLLRYANDEQRERWFPGLASGEFFLAIAMTEPGTGSDLAGVTTAKRDGDDYVINGAKTFITGAELADLVVVLARTTDAGDGNRRNGLSLIVVEAGTPGFEKGRRLEKLGMKVQDTQLAEPGTALESAIEVATKLAAGPPLAIRAVKKAFANPPASLEESLETETRLQAPLLGSEDFLEAFTAFQEKRKPQFSGT